MSRVSARAMKQAAYAVKFCRSDVGDRRLVQVGPTLHEATVEHYPPR